MPLTNDADMVQHIRHKDSMSRYDVPRSIDISILDKPVSKCHDIFAMWIGPVYEGRWLYAVTLDNIWRFNL